MEHPYHQHMSAKQKLGLLYRNFQLADQKTLSQLYKALVLPKLDYCSSLEQVRVHPGVCSKIVHKAMVSPLNSSHAPLISTGLPSTPAALGRKFCYAGA